MLASLKSVKKEDPELDPDPLVRGTDPGIRIRTKMSRIPNTGFDLMIRDIRVKVPMSLFLKSLKTRSVSVDVVHAICSTGISQVPYRYTFKIKYVAGDGWLSW